jgi:hypothetical protein
MITTKRKYKTGSRFLLLALLVVLITLCLSTTGSAQQVIMGDVNGDGRVDVRDVVLVQKHVMGKITLTAQQKALANVKGYGEINAQDVALLMQRSIGKITAFPLQVSKVDEFTKTVSLGTSQANIGLPTTVSATLNDGTKSTISVQWDTTSTPAYNPNVSGTYVFMGNLISLPSGITNPGAIKAKASITVSFLPGPTPLTLNSVNVTPTTPVVGGTLTAVVSPIGATAAYQWEKRQNLLGAQFQSIVGATGVTYTPTLSDDGYFIRVRATGIGSYSGSVTSTTIGPVTTTGTGSVQVTIEPTAARTAGAQWRLTSGPDTAWKNSGVTLSGLAPGNYTVTYSTVTGWTKPADATVAVTAGATATRTGTYVSDALELGTLIVKTATSLEVTLTKTPAADLTHANFKVEKAATEGGVFVELTGTASATPGANEFKVTKVDATTYTIGLGTAMVTGNVLKVSPSALVGNELTGPAKEVIVDLTPPVISDQVAIRTSVTQAMFTFTSTKAGSMYWVVVPDGDTAPTATEVKAGKRSGGANATAAGTYTMTAGSANQVTISSGIQSGVPYQIYYVAADNQAVPNETAVGGPFDISATVAIFIPNGTYELTAVAEGNNKIYRSGNIITIFDSSGVATAYDTAGTEASLISKTQLLNLIHTSMGIGILNAKGVGDANATTGDKVTFQNGLIVNVQVAAPTAARTLAFANNDTLPAAATLTLYGGTNSLTVTRSAALTGKITVMSGTTDFSDANIQSAIEAKGASTITVRDHATYGVVTSQAGISEVKVVSAAAAGDYVKTTGNGATVNWTAANDVTIGGTPTDVTATLTGNDAVTINANVSGTATIPATSGAVIISAGKTVNKLVVNGAFTGGMVINGTLTNLEVKAAVNTTKLGTDGTITNPIVFNAAGQLAAIDQSDIAVAKTIDFGNTCENATSITAHPSSELTIKGTTAGAGFDVTIPSGKINVVDLDADDITFSTVDTLTTANIGAGSVLATACTDATKLLITATAGGEVTISANKFATINGVSYSASGDTTITVVNANRSEVEGSGFNITINASTSSVDKTIEFVDVKQTGDIVANGTPNSGTAKLILLAELQADTGILTLAGGRVDISDIKSTTGGATATVADVSSTATLLPGARNVVFVNTTAIANVIAETVDQTVTIPASKTAEVNGVIFDVGAGGALTATVGLADRLNFSKANATAITSVYVTSKSSVDHLHFDSSAVGKTVTLLTVDSLASLQKLDMPTSDSILTKLVVNGSLYEGYVRMEDVAAEQVTVSGIGILGTLADATMLKIAKTGLVNAFEVGLPVGATFSGTLVGATVAASPASLNGLVASWDGVNSKVSGTVTTAKTTITFTDATNLTLTTP